MHFKTAVGQAVVVGGHRSDRADGILADERASRFAKGRGRGNLYVLVEVSGHEMGRDSIAEQLAQVVRDAYYGQRGSVTAGLQEAIREANIWLFDENRDSMPGEQRTAGVSCTVLRDKDLFIAQAGPAALYVAHEGQVTRFPEASPWLDEGPSLGDVDAAPLGSHHQVRVDLYHTRVTSGNTILLVDSASARHIPPQVWPDILTAGPVEAVLSELVAAAAGNELSAQAVRLGEEGMEKIPAQPSALADVQAPELVPVPVDRRARRWIEQAQVGERARAARKALVAFWSASLIFLKQMVPSQPKPQQAPRRLTTTVKKSEREKSSNRQKDAEAPRAGDIAQKLLIAIAIAIPLIVAAIVLFTVLQRDQTQQRELEELWIAANSRWIQAQTISDRAEVRALLTEAEEYLDRLLEEQPNHADALDLRERIKARLDESSQVRRVHWEGVLMTYPADANLTRVVVEGIHVFVMDRSNDKVYHHQLDEFQQSLQPATQDRVLVGKGDQVGDILVGDLVDMVWIPAGSNRQKANLLILESGGALLEYDPATKGLIPLRLATPEAWQFPQLVGGHSGRFYLLDSTANQIWRYGPTPDGYSDPPEEWLQAEFDLAGVRDMAIGDSIYLLYADGSIQKLTGGRPDAFATSDWDTPPQDPTAIFTRPPNETQWVYVADPGNNRIVQSGKEGQFKRQFRLADSQEAGDSDALSSVTSLFVDEIGGRAYFLSGNRLHMIILPE